MINAQWTSILIKTGFNQVVLKPKVDDRKIVNELYQNVEARYKDRIMVEDRILYPYQVRNYIQQSLFTVSSRMHRSIIDTV